VKNFNDFYKTWIDENISESEVYGVMIQRFVTQLCEKLAKQHHSGTTFYMTISFLKKLLDDYYEQE